MRLPVPVPVPNTVTVPLPMPTPVFDPVLATVPITVLVPVFFYCPRPHYCPRPCPHGRAESVPLLFVLQVRSLTSDPSKARYLCQLHLVAGVMTLDMLKKSDEFYTLTGKSAELDVSEGVRAGAAVA